MKSFLILSILIVFATVSCTGQNKWTKPDFRQDQFKKDENECIQTLGNGSDSQSFEEPFYDCLIKKGYSYEYEVSTTYKIFNKMKALGIFDHLIVILLIPKLR
jgi:hypothetical protein